jgi:phosphoribosylformylglycinamidine cyclo-ligase
MTKGLTYKDAGVDIDKGDEAVARIADAARKTHGPGVIGGLGGFGGLFSLKDAGIALDDPLLVSGTDGVGTKLLVAKQAGKVDGLGQDLVAMCVNDILTIGARPLFFLDYFATGALDPAHMADVVTGIARACEACGCALLGGETAELPGLYADGDFDLAGFAVGIVDRNKAITGERVSAGDVIIGLASSGLHSNGYSLARKVVFERMRLTVRDRMPDHDDSVGDVLLAPTRLYVRSILAALEAGLPIHAMAHITGGGLPGNLARPFPKGLGARVARGAWTLPPIFSLLGKEGPVDDDELLRAFNCGVGYCVVVPPSAKADALKVLTDAGERAFVIGEVVEGEGVEVVA